MNKCIHVQGVLITDVLREDLAEKILQIRDSYGETAFTETGYGNFSFKTEICGEDPIRDGIIDPLEKLFELSRTETSRFRVEGDISILSEEPGDNGLTKYETRLVDVWPEGYRIKKPELTSARTDELLDELRSRGIYMVDGNPVTGQKNWIVTSVFSESSDLATSKMVWGTEAQVRMHMFSMVKAVRKEEHGICRDATEKAADVSMQRDGSLFAYVTFERFGTVYSQYFRATPAEVPVKLTGKGAAAKSRNVQKTWITGAFNSDDETVSLNRVYGTTAQVKRHLSSLVRENRDGDPDSFEGGDTSARDIAGDGSGYLDATAQFSDYHVTISAVPEMPLQIL